MNIHDLKNTGQALIDGRWVPARPINYKIRSLRQKVKQALDVFRGKADAFYWPGNQ